MTQPDDYEIRALDALKRAVAEALERKHRLGQYAVVWREDRAVCIGLMHPPRIIHVGPTRYGCRVV